MPETATLDKEIIRFVIQVPNQDKTVNMVALEYFTRKLIQTKLNLQI